MNKTINKKINDRYAYFMSNLLINTNDGKLGKISNPRYKDSKLRFSGFPYIGSKFSEAKKKILFVGLDIGIDELREKNTFHSLDSRKLCIAGSLSGCTSLGYNDHFSGTYAMALYILQNEYSWTKNWEIFKTMKNNTFKKVIDEHKSDLPFDVLDYVAFTNIHKFVTVCRGCDLSDSKIKPKCWNEYCDNKEVNRSGGSNRKWYNKNEEIQLLLDEIEILIPDIIYFQGKESASKINDKLEYINSKSEIWIADHPSSWTVGANKSDYINSSRITIMPIIEQ